MKEVVGIAAQKPAIQAFTGQESRLLKSLHTPNPLPAIPTTPLKAHVKSHRHLPGHVDLVVLEERYLPGYWVNSFIGSMMSFILQVRRIHGHQPGTSKRAVEERYLPEDWVKSFIGCMISFIHQVLRIYSHQPGTLKSPVPSELQVFCIFGTIIDYLDAAE